MTYTLHLGDCLDILPALEVGSVDAVICDPPYGQTACAWDSVIPFAPMWAGIKHVLKPKGAVALFGSQPFTSALVMSNPGWFKYEWVWEKNRPANSHHARNMPLIRTENVSIFSKEGMGHLSLLGDSRMNYFPIGVTTTGRTKIVKEKGFHARHIGKRPNQIGKIYEVFTGFPDNILRFPKDEDHAHPTQKPVALMEYLIRTYTNEGDTVLDFTMGSGTTGVAAMHTGRKFVGIEMEAGYFAIAEERIRKAAQMADGQFVDKTGKATDLDALPLFGMEA